MKKLLAIVLLGFGGGALAAGATHDHGSILKAHDTQAHGHGHATEHKLSEDAVYNAPLSKDVKAEGCWLRLLPAPAPSAGYFIIKNSGSKDVKVKAALAAAFDSFMLHQTTHEGGMSKMSMVEDIVIPAAGELEFKPGGYHAMLEKPTRELKPGDHTNLVFLLDSGERIMALCEAKAANTLAH